MQSPGFFPCFYCRDEAVNSQSITSIGGVTQSATSGASYIAQMLAPPPQPCYKQPDLVNCLYFLIFAEFLLFLLQNFLQAEHSYSASGVISSVFYVGLVICGIMVFPAMRSINDAKKIGAL